MFQPFGIQIFILFGLDCPDFIVALSDRRLATYSGRSATSCTDTDLGLAQWIRTVCRMYWCSPLRKLSSNSICRRRAWSLGLSFKETARIRLHFDRRTAWNSLCLCRPFQLYHGMRMLQKSYLRLKSTISFYFLTESTWTWQTCACIDGSSSRYFRNEIEEHHAFVDSIDVACHLEGRQEAEYADWVWTVKHLGFQLYPSFPYHFCNPAYRDVILILVSVRQAIAAVIEDRSIVCVDLFNVV